MRRHVAPLALLLLLVAMPALAGAPIRPCRVLAEYPHSADTFTQGLFIVHGRLYESSGKYGKSFLAEVDMKTGRATRSVAVGSRYFAEGIAPLDNRIYLLTWRSGTGFIHSLDTLDTLETFRYRPHGNKSEGWGLTHDGNHFLRSSGASALYVHDNRDFSLIKTIPVRDGGSPVPLLNELEYVNGLVLANIWKKDEIVIINPGNGTVRARIDLSPLRGHLAPGSGHANGIAYDRDAKRLFVTGKHWDKLFEIALDPTLHP